MPNDEESVTRHCGRCECALAEFVHLVVEGPAGQVIHKESPLCGGCAQKGMTIWLHRKSVTRVALYSCVLVEAKRANARAA